jgi:alpha-amylase/alpha-mannosidase (GH57 family)
MRNWAMVLHFYQPPTQEDEITWNILTFCYLPLLRMLVQKSGYGITLNMSGCLLLQIQKLGSTEFFELVKKLIGEGKVEIVGSALDHPLLPITPSDVMERQIKENEKALKDLLGIRKTVGVFPPELAVSAKTLMALVHTMDYDPKLNTKV